VSEVLPDPRTRLDRCLRELADAAMSVTHHDASDTEPGYIHEVQAMEKRFRVILRTYLNGRRRPKQAQPEEPR
jgi:hypothetical protein